MSADREVPKPNLRYLRLAIFVLDSIFEEHRCGKSLLTG